MELSDAQAGSLIQQQQLHSITTQLSLVIAKTDTLGFKPEFINHDAGCLQLIGDVRCID